MLTWQVDFSKEFSLLVEAPTREDAFFAATQSIEDGDVDAHWETGDWQAFVFKAPVKHPPDHAVKDGMIVNIDDVNYPGLKAGALEPRP